MKKKIILAFALVSILGLMAQSTKTTINGVSIEMSTSKMSDTTYIAIFKVINPDYNKSKDYLSPIYIDTCHRLKILNGVFFLNIGSNSCGFPYALQTYSTSSLIKIDAGEQYQLIYTFNSKDSLTSVDLNFDFIKFSNKKTDIFNKQKEYFVKGEFFGIEKNRNFIFFIRQIVKI